MHTRLVFFLAIAAVAINLNAGFPGTDLILPAVGRVEGAGGSHFYTTLWITNPSTAGVDVMIDFLRAGQSNLHPQSVAIALAPGETRTFENVAETLFGLTNILGAARVRASSPVLVSSRIYNQNDGQTIAGSQGLFYSAIPSDFAIGAGQSAAMQGVRQDADFRYNIFLVETSGAPASARIDVRDATSNKVGSLAIDLQPYEQRLVPLSSVIAANISTAVVQIFVTGGEGHVIVSGSLIANGSQDASGFEMGFRPELLGASTPGPAGPIGPTGPQGPIGPQGLQGPAGPAGTQGPQGNAGSVGPAGPAGAQGLVGAAGAIGATGPTGATGAQGLVGPVG